MDKTDCEKELETTNEILDLIKKKHYTFPKDAEYSIRKIIAKLVEYQADFKRDNNVVSAKEIYELLDLTKLYRG